MSSSIRARSLIGLVALLPVLTQAQQCQTDSILVTTPSNQFTDHGDGTVSDIRTGLMWKKCQEGATGDGCDGGSPAAYAWQAALQQVQTVNTTGGFAGYSDWRLPNIKELRSIAERQCFDPSINLAVFPQTPSVVFWSASPYADGGDHAWVIDFGLGGGDVVHKDTQHQVRLVRAGQ